MKDSKLLNNYDTDEYYLSYCKEGSAQYTDKNTPIDENEIWKELSEIREVFKNYQVKRLPEEIY